MTARLTVEEIADQVAALMDRAPGEYQHGDGMHGDHAYNRVTFDMDGQGGRGDWANYMKPVEQLLQQRGLSIYRGPCGCPWPEVRDPEHGEERDVLPWGSEGPPVTIHRCAAQPRSCPTCGQNYTPGVPVAPGASEAVLHTVGASPP